MSTEKTEAIVIRQADFSESSRVVTFFSREFGKFATLAKGARRLKGPFDAALDLLSRCRIVFIRKSSGALGILTEASLVTRFRPDSADLVRIYGGYYVAELLHDLTEDFDAAPRLYDLAVETLDALCSSQSHPPSVLVIFEISLLREIGLLPELSECSACGEPALVGSDSSSGSRSFWITRSGLLCGACRREEYSGTAVSAGTVEILKKLSTADHSVISRLVLSAVQTSECHRFAASAIIGLTGRKPSTLRYLEF